MKEYNSIKVPNIIFWNVDTQYDFMRSDESFRGALPVAGARVIETNLEKLTNIAKDYDIKVVNSGDWHTLKDAEIDVINPDFKKTYSPHCMAGTKGAEFVPATSPENPYIILPEMIKDFDGTKVASYRNIVLYKNKFDVFTGNIHTNQVLDILKPDKIIVYGVATNVCVDAAISGLIDRKYDVCVVKDAIKELPNEIAASSLETIVDDWKDMGVKFIQTSEVKRLIQKNQFKNTLNWVKNQETSYTPYTNDTNTGDKHE